MVSVSLFAGMAEVAGTRRLSIEWSGGTVADLRRALSERCPGVVPLLEKSAVAVGDAYASDASAIPDGSDVAIIPPVSGG